MNVSPMHDPFAPSAEAQAPAPVWPSFQQQARIEQQNAQRMSFTAPQQTQPQQFHYPQHQNQTFWSPGDVARNDIGPFSSPTHPTTTAGIDPNMLVSFASSSSTIHPQQTQISHVQGDRQPYEQQIQESLRDQEAARKSRQQHSRTSTSSSTASSNFTSKPGLHRSNTDSGFRRRPLSSADSHLAAQSLDQQIMRKASPLKRLSQQSQASLSAIPEGTRAKPRTRLVIDENGTARTETVSGDQVDSRRRSGMWAEVDSDSESEPDELVQSRRSSFIFSADPVRRSKHARIDSTAETGKIARSSSSSSLGNVPFGVRRSASSSSRRGNLKTDPRRFSAASFGAGSYTSEGAERTWDMEGVEEGDAQLALKRVIEEKVRRQG